MFKSQIVYNLLRGMRRTSDPTKHDLLSVVEATEVPDMMAVQANFTKDASFFCIPPGLKFSPTSNWFTFSSFFSCTAHEHKYHYHIQVVAHSPNRDAELPERATF